jgi:hypothetical protein
MGTKTITAFFCFFLNQDFIPRKQKEHKNRATKSISDDITLDFLLQLKKIRPY